MACNGADPSNQPGSSAWARNLYRLRLDSAGCPNTYPDLAERLGPFGVEIVCDLDGQAIVDRSSGEGDELLLDLTRPIDLPVIEHALGPTGRRVVTLLPV
jgi:hypothetical protein